MSLARTKLSRFVKDVTLTVADLPASAGDQTTIAVTGLPSRGMLTRATVLMRDNAAWGSDNDPGAWYVHTIGGSAPTGQLTLAEAASIIGQAGFNPSSMEHFGSDLDIAGTTQYVWCQQLTFCGGSNSRTGSITAVDSAAVYYDVSGTTLGPEANNGTLYFTFVGNGAFDYTTIESAALRLEIAPAF